MTQFISAAIGFGLGLATTTMIYVLIGGAFFGMGIFGLTMEKRLRAKERDRRKSRR